MSHVWHELPRDNPAYLELSTDFWPWPEVFADLAARPALSGALELRQGERRVRLLLVGGQALGAQDETGSDADLASVFSSLSRAEVSLYLLGDEVARLSWLCRRSEAKAADRAWQYLRAGLQAAGFSGVVRAPSGESFWQAGARLAGPEPEGHELVSLLAAPQAAVSAAAVVEFYNAALAAAASRVALDAHWRATALELADDHLCLDPFAREVVYENGRLFLVQDVPAQELLAALREAYALTLTRAGQRAGELRLEGLRAHPVWPLSGLGSH